MKLLWDAFRAYYGWDTLVFSLDIRCTRACHENTFCPQLTFAGLSQEALGLLKGKEAVVQSGQTPRGCQVLRVVSQVLQWLRPSTRGTPLAPRQPLTPSFP